jgi:tetratricopeptide (TPR) repeat protein
MDFQGAMNSFEKALEVNPHSASAHFELGCLCEADDPAGAIYHYEQVIKLRPRSSEADLSREHINKCKLEIAKSVSTLGPLPRSTQAEMEKLLLENSDLKLQLARWQTAYGGQPPAATATNLPAAVSPTVAQAIRVKSTPVAPFRSTVANVARPAASPAAARTHTVKSGECPAAIARKYGVSVTALMAANPQAKATRLRVGQVMNVPAS